MASKVQRILVGKGTHVETVAPTTSTEQIARRLASLAIGAVVVVDGEDILGVCSERDIITALAAHGPEVLAREVRQVMSREVVTCVADTATDEVMGLMTERRVRHVPVIDAQGRLVGIVSIGDVVKSRLDELAEERAHLEAYVTGATY